MTRRTLLSALLPALFVATALVPAARAQAATPAATVVIASPGKVGRFDTAVINLSQSCRAGAVVAELVVEVKQGTLTGTKAGPLGARCDGLTHKLQVEVFSSTGDKFLPGPVQVSALFTVLDPDSMDPLPQGRDSATVTLLPAVEVAIGQEGAVGRFESVSIPVLYRCQRPWIVSGLDVNVTQGGVSGTAFRETGLVCNARWHHVSVGVSTGSGGSFGRGFADVNVSITVQDPESFDPVDQARTSKHLWIAPAARIVVVSAVLKPDGSVVVTLSARCQRPWLLSFWTASVSQNDGFVSGSTSGTSGVVCNQRAQTIVARVTGNEPFVPGSAVVSGGLFVQDPVDFDPVDSDTASRTFNLHH
jgi:hypothetical protein